MILFKGMAATQTIFTLTLAGTGKLATAFLSGAPSGSSFTPLSQIAQTASTASWNFPVGTVLPAPKSAWTFETVGNFSGDDSSQFFIQAQQGGVPLNAIDIVTLLPIAPGPNGYLLGTGDKDRFTLHFSAAFH